MNVKGAVQKHWRRGRRHLDGKPPGEGQYMSVVAVTLWPGEKDELTEIGDGNRSAGVRRLLEMYRREREVNKTEGEAT